MGLTPNGSEVNYICELWTIIILVTGLHGNEATNIFEDSAWWDLT